MMARPARDSEEWRQYHRAMHQKRRSEGLCHDCSRPATRGVRCDGCAERVRAASKARYWRMKGEPMSESLPGATTALHAEIEKLKQEVIEVKRERDAATVNLQLALAGMPGLGVVEFDSEQTSALREQLASALKRAEEADDQAVKAIELAHRHATERDDAMVHVAKLGLERAERDARITVLETALRRIKHDLYCNGRQDRRGQPSADCPCHECIARIALSPNPAAGDEGTK